MARTSAILGEQLADLHTRCIRVPVEHARAGMMAQSPSEEGSTTQGILLQPSPHSGEDIFANVGVVPRDADVVVVVTKVVLPDGAGTGDAIPGLALGYRSKVVLYDGVGESFGWSGGGGE